MTLNWAKVIVACMALACIAGMVASGRMAEATAGTLFGIIFGYTLGNGVNSAQGRDVPGIIRPRPEGRRADDDDLPPPRTG